MSQPIRIQRKRTKGWRMPENTIYVGRAKGRYGEWGNPFKVGSSSWDYQMMRSFPLETVEQVLEEYRKAIIKSMKQVPNFLEPLKGKNLACWCPLNQPCHADILLELANR